MKSYYRIMLGQKSVYADEAYKGNFIGVGWFEGIDLSKKLTENWRDFNKNMIPVYLKEHPDKSKVTAGLACGMTWTVIKGIKKGDIVLCPDGQGNYLVGEIISNYIYVSGEILPHRRPIQWLPNKISREQMSAQLRYATGAIGTVANISKHSSELEALLSGIVPSKLVEMAEEIYDPNDFSSEKQLEDFLFENWESTSLGSEYDIYEEGGEIVGKQYPTDTGPIDILAISKDKRTLLVIELKIGKPSDSVVGQITRYISYVNDELKEKDQIVKGVIIAHKDSLGIRRSLSVYKDIDFYTYKISFKLEKK